MKNVKLNLILMRENTRHTRLKQIARAIFLTNKKPSPQPKFNFKEMRARQTRNPLAQFT